jgi:hypothetical protein
MTFPSRYAVYTYAGVDFIRRIDGDDLVPWFYPDSTYTKDVVLGGAQAYIDLGASIYPPLTFRGSCLSSANRATLIAALGTTGTLSNTRGHSATVTLLKATPVNSGDYSQWWIDLLFELRP